MLTSRTEALKRAEERKKAAQRAHKQAGMRYGGCTGCEKRRKSMSAAKEAYGKGKGVLTVEERIEAARKAFQDKQAEQNGG